jgi:hypothetical protein
VHPHDVLSIVNAESMVSETVAVPAVAAPVLETVRVIVPGADWKIGV